MPMYERSSSPNIQKSNYRPVHRPLSLYKGTRQKLFADGSPTKPLLLAGSAAATPTPLAKHGRGRPPTCVVVDEPAGEQGLGQRNEPPVIRNLASSPEKNFQELRR